MSKEESLASEAYGAVCDASSVEMAEREYRNYLRVINDAFGIDAVLSMKYLYAYFCHVTEGQGNEVTIKNSIKVQNILKTDLVKKGVRKDDLLPESVKQLLGRSNESRMGNGYSRCGGSHWSYPTVD